MLRRIHPHHHGSSSLMTHTATVPVIVDVNPEGGFDPLGSASCANMRQFFPADNSNEIILHFQVSFANKFIHTVWLQMLLSALWCIEDLHLIPQPCDSCHVIVVKQGILSHAQDRILLSPAMMIPGGFVVPSMHGSRSVWHKSTIKAEQAFFDTQGPVCCHRMSHCILHTIPISVESIRIASDK